MVEGVKQTGDRARPATARHGRSASLTVIASIAAAAPIALILMMNMVVNPYDESLVLQGAVEVGSGLVPHRDFFWTYGPLQLWIVAALFAAFGKTVIVARLYDLVVRTAIVLLCGLTARRLGLRTSAVAVVMVFETLLLQATGFYLYPVFPSVMLALAGTLLLIDDRPGGEVSAGRPAGAGALTGLTALIRYDIGFFLLLGHIAALAFVRFEQRRSARGLARPLIAYVAGVAVIFLPVAVWAWLVGAIPGFFHDVVSFPKDNYARMRHLPWPVPGPRGSLIAPLVSYLPFLVAALGLAWLVRTARRPSPMGETPAPRRLAAALLLLTILFVFKGVVRVSLVHSVLALIPALPLLAYLLDRSPSGGWRSATLAVVGFACVTILLNVKIFSVPAEVSGLHALLGGREPMPAVAGAPGGQCRLPALGPGQIEPDSVRAVCYIDAHTRPDAPIFVGLDHYDTIFASNPGLYFFSDRRPSTRWYHMEPGLQTQASVQRDIIADLDRRRVALIAIDRRFDRIHEPNDSSVSSGVHDLDRFIATHFTEAARFGEVTILTRPPPPAPGR